MWYHFPDCQNKKMQTYKLTAILQLYKSLQQYTFFSVLLELILVNICMFIIVYLCLDFKNQNVPVHNDRVTPRSKWSSGGGRMSRISVLSSPSNTVLLITLLNFLASLWIAPASWNWMFEVLRLPRVLGSPSSECNFVLKNWIILSKTLYKCMHYITLT